MDSYFREKLISLYEKYCDGPEGIDAFEMLRRIGLKLQAAHQDPSWSHKVNGGMQLEKLPGLNMVYLTAADKANISNMPSTARVYCNYDRTLYTTGEVEQVMEQFKNTCEEEKPEKPELVLLSMNSTFKKVNYFGIELFVRNTHNFLATDKDGCICSFAREPLKDKARELWRSSGGTGVTSIALGTVKFIKGSWEESLVEIKGE